MRTNLNVYSHWLKYYKTYRLPVNCLLRAGGNYAVDLLALASGNDRLKMEKDGKMLDGGRAA
jgi:hypothetical protein